MPQPLQKKGKMKMKTHIEKTYICEYCGKEFEEDELEECEEHEALEKLLHECRFWDDKREEIHGVNYETMADDVYYFYAPSIQHVEAVSDWFVSCGLDFTREIPCGGMYAYDRRTETWYSTFSAKTRLLEIEALAV